MGNEKFASLCVLVFGLAVVGGLAFYSTVPDTTSDKLRQCGNSCHLSSRPMVSWSEADGCRCEGGTPVQTWLPQGPL